MARPDVDRALLWHRRTLLVFNGFFLAITITSIVVGFTELAAEEHREEVSEIN